MQVLLPGDPLPVPSSSTSLHLGPGLSSSSSSSSSSTPSSSTSTLPSIQSTRAGLLGSISTTSESTPSKFWIESSQKRYVPSPTEPVLGIITARHSEGFKVDIGSSQFASLDSLAFEGATKRNKPNLKIGTLVYGYLLPTPTFSEPELSCVDQTTQKSSGFGELSGGFLIRNVELGRCRSLLSPKNTILNQLGSKFPFEVAVGMNGRIWVKGTGGAGAGGGMGEESEKEELEKMCKVIQQLKG
ncbi:hypothetical protein JCM3765_002486 [Sporobolomyces pararoseus]